MSHAFKLIPRLHLFVLAVIITAVAIVPAHAQSSSPSSASAPANAADQAATASDLRQSFVAPPDDTRIMMRWWWFGPSVTKDELERELRVMKAGGIGGVELQPVYPQALDDPTTGFHNFPYLSDEFLGDLRFASDKARELGIRFDLTLGSGWPFGGPNTPEQLEVRRNPGVRTLNRPAHVYSIEAHAISDQFRGGSFDQPSCPHVQQSSDEGVAPGKIDATN